jgi:hypothetical protein
MYVWNIIEELSCDIISDKLGVFKLETGQYFVIHYSDSPRIIEFDDHKEFASHIVNYIADYMKEFPDFSVGRQDFDFLSTISKLLTIK